MTLITTHQVSLAVPGDAAEGDTHLAPDESRLSFISSPLTSPAHSSSETG